MNGSGESGVPSISSCLDGPRRAEDGGLSSEEDGEDGGPPAGDEERRALSHDLLLESAGNMSEWLPGGWGT